MCRRHYASAWANAKRAANPEEARTKRAAWRAANPEKVRAETAKRYHSHPEEFRARNRAWVKTDHGAAYRKGYYEANKEQYRQQLRAWRKANPERARAQWSNRQARLRGAEGEHTAKEVAALLCKQKERCAICRVSISGAYHKDHVVALSSGGGNGITNIQLLCPSCNTSKGAKDPIEFMQGRGFLL